MSPTGETFFTWFKTLPAEKQQELLADIYDYPLVISKGLYSGPMPAVKGLYSGLAPSSLTSRNVCPKCGKPL